MEYIETQICRQKIKLIRTNLLERLTVTGFKLTADLFPFASQQERISAGVGLDFSFCLLTVERGLIESSVH